MLLKVWSRDLEAVDDLVASWRMPPDEVATVGKGLFALLPGAGETDLVEAAYVLAQRLFLAAPEGSEIQALILLGQVLQIGEATRVTSDLLLDDVQKKKPELPDRTVLLTSHAVRELEGSWSTERWGAYRGPSGHSYPLLALLQPRVNGDTWRNPRLLGRATRLVEREH